MKVAIIGGGVSGLSLAKMLNKEHETVVYEKENKVGGLIKCDRINDCLFHKVGGHVFNTKNSKVNEWFWSHFDKDNEFISSRRNAQILYKGKMIGYPIENNIYTFDKETISKIIDELLVLHKSKKIRVNNFEDFLINNFGDTLYHIYFKPYNEKIWNVDLRTIPLEWLEGKLPMPNLNEIFENNITKIDESKMVHSSFYYPKYDGSQFIVNRLKEDIKIFTNISIDTIVLNEEGITLNDGQTYNSLVYTGDIRRISNDIKKLLLQNDVNINYINSLRSNGTSNLFCETDENNLSWLYIPEKFSRAHRIIYTGNFSPSNNRGSVRKTCVVEFSGKIDYNTMVKEIEMLPGNLTPIAYNYEPDSYIIHDEKTKNEISKAKKVLERYNIYLLGRFAEWEYYNMDKAIESAFNIKEQINNK